LLSAAAPACWNSRCDDLGAPRCPLARELGRHGARLRRRDDEEPGEIIGFLHLRHELNDYLLEEGGHIGYSVRPARRREGHAGRALALGVRRAADLGVDRVLVTCDVDNDASRRTIERNDGALEDTRGNKRRYWITVG
jgi:predicted acetyltransferase